MHNPVVIETFAPEEDSKGRGQRRSLNPISRGGNAKAINEKDVERFLTTAKEKDLPFS